jgi:hypothetical protein
LKARQFKAAGNDGGLDAGAGDERLDVGTAVPANTGRTLRRSIRTMTMADAWIGASGIDRRKICSRKYFGYVQQHILMCRGTKSSLATKDEARRIAANVAKLTEAVISLRLVLAA